MFLKFFLPLVLVLFACAPLRPIGPVEETPSTPEEKKEPLPPAPEPVEPDTAKKQIIQKTIDVGIGFEKKSAVIECPEKKWEFKVKAGTNSRTEIETNGNCIYAGKSYRGSWIVISADTGLTIINHLDTEDYLKGVVPHEIGKLNIEAFEALKAQAVAARTYAYVHLGSRKLLGFDVYADTRDQVYNGRNDEDSLVNEAILATSNVVIKYDGNLIEAYYHSTCGGKTESPEIWEQDSKPFLASVSDATGNSVFCELSKYRRWEEKFNKTELVNLFQKNATNAKADKIFPFSKIELILITEKFPSGRIKRLVVFTDQGSFEVFGDKVRWLFQRDGKILPSALFSISKNGDDYTISGSGFGHGIGMCQFGVIARAKAGQKFDEILKAYYTGVSVERLLE
jgi:stage II sporulation protein D